MDEPTEPVKRRCKWCDRRYVVQKGSRSDGCAECAPTLEQLLAEDASASPSSPQAGSAT